MAVLTVIEAVRFVVLGSLLMQYRAVTWRSHADESIPATSRACAARNSVGDFINTAYLARSSLRVMAVMALFIFLLQKIAVLSTSLPVNRPPPTGRFARRFFISDHWYIA